MKNESRAAAEPFDEHANEEKYFSAQEHELIKQMKNEHQGVEAAKRRVLSETCPKCSGKLDPDSVKGVIVERCESCEGIWLNKGALDEILRRQAAGPLGTFLERCFGKMK